MNIDFELYRIFYTVANNGNITKAAEELMISQPAISKSIKNLEEQLGGQLFVRTKRGVFLTEEGREFYNYIKQAMEYIHRAENKFTDLMNLEEGNIRIGISTTLVKEFLLPYLEEFHSTYPNITIEIITDLASVLIPKLRNGLIDIIILNLNGKNSFRIMMRDARNCPSPNSGYTMASTAGALDIKLVKKDTYVLGDENKEINVEDIEKAVKLSKLTIILFTFTIILLLILMKVIL